MKYIPQTRITIPNTETIDTPYVGDLDPSGWWAYRAWNSWKGTVALLANPTVDGKNPA